MIGYYQAAIALVSWAALTVCTEASTLRVSLISALPVDFFDFLTLSVLNLQATGPRRLTGECASAVECFLVNIDDMSTTALTPNTALSYDRENAAGEIIPYSIRCDLLDNTIDRIVFAYDEGMRDEFSPPYYLAGDNGHVVHPSDFLSASCGTKELVVSGFIYTTSCFEPQTYILNPVCNPICGNGDVEGDEECDLGTRNGGEECRDDCTKPVCGDSIVDQGEECDDGNTASGDGCDSTCNLEPVCGNGEVEEGEQCDDGNARSGDGCSSNCRKEVTKEQCPKDGCTVFSGPVDYVAIGNSMSVSEDRRDCSKKSSSSANLSVPSGTKVVKAFLQWSGSGSKDSRITFNGHTVNAAKTLNDSIGHSFQFFGAYADVTNLVTGSGKYTVKNLEWNNWNPYCGSNAAYGAWSLVVVYSSPSLDAGTRLHVCQDNFRFTYPAGKYSTDIECIEASNSCRSDAQLTLVAFEGDSYKGEKFSVGGKFLGNNLFHGSTAPNLDIKTFDLGDKTITGSTSSLSYTIESFKTYTVFGLAIEGLFDFVKVVKYQSTCH